MKNFVFQDPPGSWVTEFGSGFSATKWRDRIAIIHIKIKKSSVLSTKQLS